MMSNTKRRKKNRKKKKQIANLQFKSNGPNYRKRWSSSPNIKPPYVIETLDDLLYIAWNSKNSLETNGFDWFRLWGLIPALTELNKLVGMREFKKSIISLVLYFLQDLHVGDKEGELRHTMLYGKPGCGKSTAAHILAKIYCRMGFLKSDKVIVAKRGDFIGKWVGHSESKTRGILESAINGVLFIDEAYSLGNGEKTDVFAKAIVNEICPFLTEHAHEMICIIAGYKEDIQKNFFAVNPGLESRFIRRYNLEEYTPEELFQIFQLKVSEIGWGTTEDALSIELYHNNPKAFPAFGRSIKVFITECKEAHSRRMFGYQNGKRILTKEDITNGFEAYSNTLSNSKDTHFEDNVRHLMYT